MNKINFHAICFLIDFLSCARGAKVFLPRARTHVPSTSNRRKFVFTIITRKNSNRRFSIVAGRVYPVKKSVELPIAEAAIIGRSVSKSENYFGLVVGTCWIPRAQRADSEN